MPPQLPPPSEVGSGSRHEPPKERARPEAPPLESPSDGTANLVRITCRSCQHKFRVKSNRSGPRVKCPKCSKPNGVPGSDGSGRVRVGAATDPRRFAKLAAALPEQPRTAADALPGHSLSNRALGKLVKEIETREPRKNEILTASIKRRQEVIEKLGESRDGRAWETLVGQFEDPSPAIRRSAIQALGTVGDPRAVPALVALLDTDDPEVRRETVTVLGKIGDRRAVRALVQLGFDDARMKFPVHGAVTSMGEVSTPELLEFLNDGDDGFVLEGIVLLGRLRDPKAVKALIAVIESRPSATFRIHAAEALGQIGDERAVPTLTSLLQDDDPGVRVGAAGALGRMPRSANAKALVRALRDPDADVRRLVAEALGEVGDKRAGDALARLLGDTDDGCRLAATEALGKIGDERALEPLLAMLDSDDEAALLKAIGAFRKLRDPRAVEKLIDFLYHERSAVRQRAVESLGSVGDSHAAERMEGVLKTDRATEVRIAAAKALGEIRDPGSIDALEQALQDEFQVRCRAIVALGRIGDEQSLPALLAMLRDPVPEVRFQATGALAELGAKGALGPLESLLDDDNTMVRRGAAKALVKLGDPRGDELLEIAAKPRKRKRRKTVSRGGPMFDLSALKEMSPAELVASIWPRTPRGRAIAAAAVLVPVLLLGAFFWTNAPGGTLQLRGRYASMDFSPVGDRLYVGRSLGLVEIWDAETGKLADQRPVDETLPIKDIVVSADGKAFVAVVGAKLVHVPESGDPVDLGVVGSPRLVASADNAHCAAVARTGVVTVFETATGHARGAPLQLPANVADRAVAVDPSGQRVAVAQSTGVLVYDTTNPANQVVHNGPKVTAIAFSADGTRLAALSEKAITVWNAGTGTPDASVPVKGGDGVIRFTTPDTVLAVARQTAFTWHTASGTAGSRAVEGEQFVLADGRVASGSSEDSAVLLFSTADDEGPKRFDVVTHDPMRKSKGWLW